MSVTVAIWFAALTVVIVFGFLAAVVVHHYDELKRRVAFLASEFDDKLKMLETQTVSIRDLVRKQHLELMKKKEEEEAPGVCTNCFIHDRLEGDYLCQECRHAKV
jgi:hypothetical protein